MKRIRIKREEVIEREIYRKEDRGREGKEELGRDRKRERKKQRKRKEDRGRERIGEGR